MSDGGTERGDASADAANRPIVLESPDLAPGDRVGDYVVLGMLGQGGMGIVYLAYDPRLDRKVALKVLRSASSIRPDESRSFRSAATPDTHAGTGEPGGSQLVHEAQSMARLTHPNVVAVYQVGEVDGRVFIAMEYIEGKTLREWIDTDRPSTREVLDALVQAGRGLQAAHEADVVHRDFKAENILLGKDGRVCVTDFGLASTKAAMAESPPSGDAGAREQGQSTVFGGTPKYMAPEQHLRQPTDARTDQFSFCVTLYYALFGVWPFSGQTDQEYADAVIHGRVNPPPVRRSERWLRPIILRGLAAAPGQRHASMRALLAELDRKPRLWRNLAIAAGVLALAGTIAFVTMRRDQPAPCSGSERHLVGVWDKSRADAVKGAMLATKVPYAASTVQRVTDGLDAYAAQWTAMHRSTCEATRVRGEQSEKLLDLRMACLERRKGELAVVVDLVANVDAKTIPKAVDSVSRLSPVTHCARIESLNTVIPEPRDPKQRERLHALQRTLDSAKAEFNLSSYRASLDHLSAMLAEVEKLGYPPLHAEVLLLRGQIEWRLGDLEKSEASLMAALAAAEQGRDDDLRAAALIELAYVVGWERGRVSEGLTWASIAEGTLSRVASNDRLRADLHRSRASVLFRAGRYEEALKGNSESCSILRRLLGERHHDVALCLANQGNILVKLGRYPESLDLANQALGVAEAALGKDHPSLGDFFNTAGNSYATVGEPKKAAAMYRKALELYRNALGPDAPLVAIALSNLGSLELAQGDSEAALKYFSNALEIEEKALGPGHQSTAETLAKIGDTYLHLGRPADAVPVLERAWAVHEARTPPPPEVAPVALSLARALSATDATRERAIALARRARELASAGEGEEWGALVSEIDEWLAEHAP